MNTAPSYSPIPERPDSDIAWEAFYTISAKSLQAYVMAGGKLREMTGATLLIDELPRKLLEQVLSNAGLVKNKDWWPVTQASGIARLLVAKLDNARRLERLMPLIVAEFAPGLEIVQAVVEVREKSYSIVALEAEHQLIVARNFPSPWLPVAPPISTLNPRTGLPAVKVEHGSRLDAPAHRKRQRRNEHRQNILNGNFSDITTAGTYRAFGFDENKRKQVAKHFDHLASGPNENTSDPGLDAFTGGEGRFMAVMHADGNGMGEMFIRLGEALSSQTDSKQNFTEVAALYAALSGEIGTATMKALEASSGKILDQWLKDEKDSMKPKKPLPIWPIVVAGDDLSALFRADVALRFSQDYITAFASETELAFNRVRENFPWAAKLLDDRLTAGAGIVLCKTHYPYRTAYSLCESLATHAKKTAKRKHEAAGSVTFHRLLGTTHVTAWSHLQTSILSGDQGIELSLAPYFIGVNKKGEAVPQPTLMSLEALADAVKALPSGPVRQLLTYLRTDKTEAERHWKRMAQMACLIEKSPEKKNWTDFCNTLATLTGKPAGNNDFMVLFDNNFRTPLADALVLLESRPDPIPQNHRDETSPPSSPTPIK